MQGILNIGQILTSAKGWKAIFLTLVCCFFPTQNVFATDDETAYISVPSVSSPQSSYSPLNEIDKGHRIAQLRTYVEQQMPGLAPGLREDLRTPLSWLRSVRDAFRSGDDDDVSGGSDGFLSPLFQPVSSLMHPPSPAEAEALWLSPGYHHKGFLPFHDAMTTGMNFRESFLDGRIQFNLQPFYGQNWVSLNGYGGAQLGVSLTHSGEAKPWGQISLRYTEGASYLMDHGHGIEMSAELRFDDSLSLKAGVRGDEQTELGNYAILRWKLVEFGK